MIPLETELPEGAELTLAELREMAARQQQQIEAQQQLLVAKEQRLKFLKQQEACHHSGIHAQETEHLHHLREKVEAQEMKLRRLRALRGQVDQQKANNGNLSSELDSIRALFNEKEKELSVAVAKVEELTRQLEELRHGNLNCIPNSTALNVVPATLELDKLKRELMYRTKLNDQQNARIAQQREKLEQRQGEISCIDERIAELQQRLQRKRMLNQQLVNQIHAATLARQAQVRPNQCKTRFRPLSANIATVEPLRRVPQEQERSQDDMITKLNKNNEDYLEFAPNKNDPKYQTLPYNTKFSLNKNNCETTTSGKAPPEIESSGKANEDGKPLRNQNSVPQPPPPPPSSTCPYDSSTTQSQQQSQPGILVMSNRTQNAQIPPPPKLLPPPCLTNFAPRPYTSALRSQPPACSSSAPNPVHVSTSTTTRLSGSVQDVMASRGMISPTSSSSSSSSRNKVPPPGAPTNTRQDRISPEAQSEAKSIPHSQNTHSNAIQMPQWVRPNLERNSIQSMDGSGSGLTTKPILPPKPSLPIKPVPPPRQTHLMGSAGGFSDTSPETLDSALCVLKSSTSSSSGSGRPFSGYSNYKERLLYYQMISQRYRGGGGSSFSSSGHNSSSSNEGPFVAKEDRNSSESVSVEANDTHGVKDDSNQSSQARISNIQKSELGELYVIPDSSFLSSKRHGDDGSRNNDSQSSARDQGQNSSDHTASIPNVHISINRRIEMPPSFLFPETPSSISSSKLTVKDDEANEQRINASEHGEEGLLSVSVAEANRTWNSHSEWADEPDCHAGSPLGIDNYAEEQGIGNAHKELSSSSLSSDQSSPERGNDAGNNEEEDGLSPSEGHSAALRRVKKGNLKSKGSAKNTRRVSFDPLALLLDAALEGELELVRKTAREVPNPSAENDEGITALHNAICAGHFEIVKFLVEFGCDVNAQDSDGWTPLHCAASCNNLPMVKFLVEHGACIFATTLSDHETAAEKCEEDEEGFDGCSEYLYSIQEKLGILNGGSVYAVYDYDAQNPDELSFKDGDLIVVLRKGDEMEREWWWSKLRDQEGYVPRNLLGLYPRVTVRKDQ